MTRNKFTVERIGVAVSVLTFIAMVAGGYVNLIEASTDQAARLTAVEATAEKNSVKREQLDEKINGVNKDLQDLKTNTVLICNKLKIDRCK
jgi:hypothetical protein